MGDVPCPSQQLGDKWENQWRQVGRLPSFSPACACSFGLCHVLLPYCLPNFSLLALADSHGMTACLPNCPPNCLDTCLMTRTLTWRLARAMRLEDKQLVFQLMVLVLRNPFMGDIALSGRVDPGLTFIEHTVVFIVTPSGQ